MSRPDRPLECSPRASERASDSPAGQRDRASSLAARWVVALGTRPRLAVFVAFAVPYLCFAWCVGRSYPMNRMRMFAPPTTVASQVVARTADGLLRDVTFFTRWSCGDALVLGHEASGAPLGGDEIARSRILRHVGTPLRPVPVELVRRTSRIPVAHGPLVQDDVVILRCDADLLDAPEW